MSLGSLFASALSFIINFLAYVFVFLLIAALAVLACFIGIKWRKSKDAKEMIANESTPEEEV